MASAAQEAAGRSLCSQGTKCSFYRFKPSYPASKVEGASFPHRPPSLLKHSALLSPVLYSAPALQRVKWDPVWPLRDNVGITSEKAGDWTLALSLTDPDHVSLLGLSPGQSSGESGDLSSLASAGALVSFGCPGCPRWVGVLHTSVTGPGEHGGGGGGVETTPWEKVAIEPRGQPRQPGALRGPGRKQASSWLRHLAPGLEHGEEVAQPLGGAQGGKMALEKVERSK